VPNSAAVTGIALKTNVLRVVMTSPSLKKMLEFMTSVGTQNCVPPVKHHFFEII
jgi:hypothetical protein